MTTFSITCPFLYYLICSRSGHCCHFQSPVQRCHSQTKLSQCDSSSNVNGDIGFGVIVASVINYFFSVDNNLTLATNTIHHLLAGGQEQKKEVIGNNTISSGVLWSVKYGRIKVDSQNKS